MTKEVFLDEWIFRPRTTAKNSNSIQVKTRIPLEPFQLYVVKLYKLVVSKKEDYTELMEVMKNLRLADRKQILAYFRRFIPGKYKISNVRVLKEAE